MTMIIGLAIFLPIYLSTYCTYLSICLSIYVQCYAMSYELCYDILYYTTILFYSSCVYVVLCLWKREVVGLTSWDLQFLCLTARVFRRVIVASSAAWHLLLTFGALNKHGPCVPIYSWDHQYSTGDIQQYMKVLGSIGEILSLRHATASSNIFAA